MLTLLEAVVTAIRTHYVVYGVALNALALFALVQVMRKRDASGIAAGLIALLLLVVPALINNYLYR